MPDNTVTSKNIKLAKEIYISRHLELNKKQRSWDLYFLKMLDLVKTRSPDPRTKVGCILTDDNRVVSCGYNGLPTRVDWEFTNEDKYEKFLHSEQNAICNLLVKPNEPVAYITHYPCQVCSKMLWQIGCYRIVVPKNSKFKSYSEKDEEILYKLVQEGLSFIEIDTVEVSPELTANFE